MIRHHLRTSSRIAVACAFAVMALAASGSQAEARGRLSDGAIRQILVRQSIESYPGNCPCPYNSDRAGRSCGRRSAYSRPGGYAPLCYSGDVSRSDVEGYRREHGGRENPLGGDFV